MAAYHVLNPTPDTVHRGYFDAKIPPRLSVESGATVTIDTVAGGRAQIDDLSILRPEHREIHAMVKRTLIAWPRAN